MEQDGTTNSQITDSVTQTTTGVLGHAPASSQGLLDVAMAETVGLGMYNAVTAQHHSQMVNGAAVTATCARLLQPRQVDGPPAPPTPTSPISPINPPDQSTDPANVIQAGQAAESNLLSRLGTAVKGNEQLLDKVKTMFDPNATGSEGGDKKEGDNDNGSKSES